MSGSDIEGIADRVAKSLSHQFREAVGYKSFLFSQVCESPIEIMFAVAFNVAWDLDAPTLSQHLWVNRDLAEEHEAAFVPQYAIGEWRVDFVFRWVPFERGVVKYVFECDGHDFHEKTKEQASRDKKRDRDLVASGYKVMRFTGSEIYRNAAECARQAIKAIKADANRQLELLYPESVG